MLLMKILYQKQIWIVKQKQIEKPVKRTKYNYGNSNKII